MTSLITPWLRNFWTDVWGPLGNFQEHPICAPRELAVVDCLEAHGVFHGKTKCRILLDDFRECVVMGKQEQRVKIMSFERRRQIAAGERDEDDAFAPPPRVDAY